MRSRELASLAGVSVRTLRHYHQVGVLPEPGRGRNGYRDYTVHDLVRLLRVRRLAALGLSLEKAVAVLDGEQQDQAGVLEQLEADLDAGIAHLQQRKELLSLLRAHRLPADLPPESGGLLELLTVPGVSPAAARIDREQALLLAHLVGGRGLHLLTELSGQLARPGVRDVLVRVAQDLDGLAREASEGAVDDVVHRAVTRLAPLVQDVGATVSALLPEGSTAVDLLRAHQDGELHPAQRRALARIAELLQEAVGAPDRELPRA